MQHALFMTRSDSRAQRAVFARLITGLGVTVGDLVAARDGIELYFTEGLAVILIRCQYLIVGRHQNSGAFIALEHRPKVTNFVCGYKLHRARLSKFCLIRHEFCHKWHLLSLVTDDFD